MLETAAFRGNAAFGDAALQFQRVQDHVYIYVCVFVSVLFIVSRLFSGEHHFMNLDLLPHPVICVYMQVA